MPAKSKTSPRNLKDPCTALKRKLQERDAELKEARAQQAAVSDILRVISGTATDVKPVLRSITGCEFPSLLHDNSHPSCQAILRREAVQIGDLHAEDWGGIRTSGGRLA